MRIRLARFNLFLLVLLSVALSWGCQSDKNQKKAPKKGYSLLRLHIEVGADGTDKNGTVMIGRQSPFPINVNKLAFVESTHLARASLVEDGLGGFQIKIQLERQGTWLLEQYTVANKGRHIAVFAELEDFRWLAAPLVTQKISDGVFTFTPDATREEAEKLVLGLNKAIKKARSRNSLNDPEVK